MQSRKSLLERIKDRRLIGLLQAHPNPVLTEIAGISGYDFVMLDDEHGLFGNTDYVQALQVLSSTSTLGFVRLSSHDTHAVGRYLDMGADVIVAPNVATAEEAQNLVRSMTYPPTGTRGIGAALHRATRYGLDHAGYLSAPRAGVSLLAIIESARGASNVEEILAVDGVDGAIVGPSDLSADLGHPGGFSRPEYIETLAHIEMAARSSGKVLGTVPHPGNSLEQLIARGYCILILGSDVSLIGEAMRTQVSNAAISLSSAG